MHPTARTLVTCDAVAGSCGGAKEIERACTRDD